MGQPFRKPRAPLATELQTKIRERIRHEGIDAVAEAMGLCPNTVANMAAGRGCNESSKLLARIYLDGAAV